MRIQPSEVIAGQPALAVRKLMQRGRHNGPTTLGNSIMLIAEVLSVDLPSAQLIFQELCKEGYIELAPLHPDSDEKGDCWYTTIKGNALANATARKPISRQTAEKLLKQFLNRVQQVNVGGYAYRVKQVIVFGSYLSDAPTLGDIDLSLVLEDRYSDEMSRKRGHEARVDVAIQAGRNFRDYMDQLGWPEREVLLFLKNRSSSLSLHYEWIEKVLERRLPSRIVFDADVALRSIDKPL